MEINSFAEKFQEQFIDGDEISVATDTEFRKLPSWDSLTGMSILVMIQDEYNVDFKEGDLKACKTVGDVFESVKSKVI